jgi:beta-lactamase regulating signal transducer with metallopeptidase domain
MTAATFNLQFLAQISAERMLNCTAQGLGIALLAWILLRVTGRRNSGTRFAVWFSALLGIAALPLFGHLASSGAGMTQRSEIAMPASWALYIFAGWLLLAAAGLARVGMGFWHLHRLRKTCVPIDGAALDPLLRKTVEEFDSPRPVAVCVSDQLRVPTAIGFIRPLVVIPSWTMQELSATELNAIVLHELAHLRRWDDWTNLVQKILGALFFFHPAVWWIEKKLALEREMACDDLVLAKTASPRVYAECLVSLAEKSFLRRGFALAQAAVNRMGQVSLRVSRILDVNRPSATRVWKPAPILLSGISLACLVAISNTPQLVSFEGGPGSSPAAASVAAIVPGSIETSQDSRTGASIIPARLEVKPRAKSTVPAAASASRPGMVSAKAVQPRPKPTLLVRTGAAGDAATYQTLVFVMRTQIMQSRPDDPSGSVVWHLCVWQVTVIGPAQKRMEPGIIAKSI